MKIAFVTPFFFPVIGGVEQVVYELGRRLIKEGHEVHVFTSDCGRKEYTEGKGCRLKEKELEIDGIKVHRGYHLFHVSDRGTVWLNYGKLWKEDFDIVHSHVIGHFCGFMAGMIAKVRGIKYIHTTHCPWTDRHRPFLARLMVKMAGLTWGKWTLRLADKIISITPWEFDQLRKWGADKEKIIYISNGMDEVFFKKIKDNRFKRKFKGKIVLFLGRLHITKGPEKLVIAAKEILKDRDIDFVFVGPDEGMLKEMEKVRKGEKRIHILGTIRGKKKLAEIYQAADVYVLPSYREGLPLTLFEAYASGLPVVASPVNGVPYEMKDGVNGFFVEYGDIENLKKKILKVLDDRELSDRFSKNNREKAKDFSWDKILERTKKVYGI